MDRRIRLGIAAVLFFPTSGCATDPQDASLPPRQTEGQMLQAAPPAERPPSAAEGAPVQGVTGSLETTSGPLGGATAAPETRAAPSEPAPPVEGTQEAQASPPARDVLRACNRRLGTVVITDVHGGLPQEAMNYYQLQLPPLSKIAEHVGRALKCFDVLDNDPALASTANALDPDYLLRVRPVEVKMSTDVGALGSRLALGLLGIFAGSGMVAQGAASGSAVLQGLGGGVASGSSAAAHGRPMQVDQVSVGIEIVCPKQRRVAADFVGAETPATIESDKRYVFPWPADKVNLNQELVARAYANAQADLVAFISSKKNPCSQ